VGLQEKRKIFQEIREEKIGGLPEGRPLFVIY